MVNPAQPTLITRRLGGVDVRAATELITHQARARGRAVDADAFRAAVQAVLEDSDRTLVLGAFHEGLPGFQHGKMVGLLFMNVNMSLERAGEVGWIEELYVQKDYRQKGLGNRLLAQALTWAEGRGLRALELEVHEATDGHEPEAAQRLYGKAGFVRAERRRMQKTLGQA